MERSLLYKKESRKKPVSVCTPLYPNKKIPREIISDAVECGLPNYHNCGLFNYVWILAHAHTYSVVENGKELPKYAYLSSDVSELKKAFCVKRRDQCVSSLELLAKKGLIRYSIQNEDIGILALKYRCVGTYSRKKAGIESCSIKKNRGFIFLNIFSIRKYFRYSGRYSIRDVLISIWLNIAYNDPNLGITKDCAFMSVYNGFRCSPRLRQKTLGRKWGCALPTVSKMLKELEKAGFIHTVRFHRTGTFIAVKNYSEILYGIQSINVTREYILVRFLGEDPNPEVRKRNRLIKKRMFILKFRRIKRENNWMELRIASVTQSIRVPFWKTG